MNGRCKNVRNKINYFDNFESVHHGHEYSCNNNDYKELSYIVNDVVEHISGFVIRKLNQKSPQ